MLESINLNQNELKLLWLKLLITKWANITSKSPQIHIEIQLCFFPIEINQVRIVGTLIEDAYTLKSGTKALTVRIQESPSTQWVFYDVFLFIMNSYGPVLLCRTTLPSVLNENFSINCSFESVSFAVH